MTSHNLTARWDGCRPPYRHCDVSRFRLRKPLVEKDGIPFDLCKLCSVVVQYGLDSVGHDSNRALINPAAVIFVALRQGRTMSCLEVRSIAT